MVELPFSQNCASLFKSASVTFPVPVSRIHSLSFSHKFFVDSHHVYKKKVISILILDFGKWNFLGCDGSDFVLQFCSLCIGVFFQYHTETVKTCLLWQCNWESVDWSGRSEWNIHRFWLCSWSHLYQCMEQNLHNLLLSIIFINSITDYLPVNVRLIDPPSVFVFIQLCLATSLWVSTALLDYEQLTSTHSLDHHQDHHVPVWIF